MIKWRRVRLAAAGRSARVVLLRWCLFIFLLLFTLPASSIINCCMCFLATIRVKFVSGAKWLFVGPVACRLRQFDPLHLTQVAVFLPLNKWLYCLLHTKRCRLNGSAPLPLPFSLTCSIIPYILASPKLVHDRGWVLSTNDVNRVRLHLPQQSPALCLVWEHFLLAV